MTTREIDGIPVRFDGRQPIIARARGFWPFKTITVNPAFLDLAPREQQAILLHEAHHCHALHLELRLLWSPFFWARSIQRWTEQQELDADAYAVKHGYGVDLLGVVCRRPEPKQPFRPAHLDRVEHLIRCLGRFTNEQAA